MGYAGNLINRANLTLVAIGLFGICLVLYGTTIPIYSDLESARQLKLAACDQNTVGVGWYERMEALQTNRYPLMQAGLSVVLSAIIAWLLRRTFPGNGSWLPSSPNSRASFFALSFGVLAASWLSEIVSLTVDQHRGDFRPCDYETPIWMMGLLVLFFLIPFLFFVLGGLMTRKFGKLPVSLAQWDSDHPAQSWIITSIAGVPAITVLAVMALSFASSSLILMPAGVVALYLIAATRAALLSK
ncbi:MULTISPECIES: hypothetical protein [unclassified Novosphingobium]|uniref:hypothetical protein n=1 Tax=unclassified Novosphingobium TaxID=2644732 RepID=UPI0025E7F247|nr:MULTISPECIES: hypothetical protein [unclassified Novosphingobium]HQV03010.1 hypothetical protein [Novosphingobium sp.]